MNYITITKINKVQPKQSIEFPYEIYQRIAYSLGIGLTLLAMALFEKYAIGKVLIVWFMPILGLLIFINFRIFRRVL